MVKFIYNKKNSFCPFVPDGKSIKKAGPAIPCIVFVMDEEYTWGRLDLAKAIAFASYRRSKKKEKS